MNTIIYTIEQLRWNQLMLKIIDILTQWELSRSNDKDSKFKAGDHVRISKYKNIFAKGCTPNLSEELFVIKKVRNTVQLTYVINDLNDDEIIGTFYEKELQKTNQR